MSKAKVLIILGSASDETYLEKCVKILSEMEVSFDVKVASAHRSPERLFSILKSYEDSAQVVIAMAGHAAHLGGVIASKVSLPVVAVPIPSSNLQGLDSLLATVQMPGGVPVATMAIGNAGSQNAACFATQILALHDPALKERWLNYRKAMGKKVETSSELLEEKWNQ